jgi:hypothetical protein
MSDMPEKTTEMAKLLIAWLAEPREIFKTVK